MGWLASFPASDGSGGCVPCARMAVLTNPFSVGTQMSHNLIRAPTLTMPFVGRCHLYARHIVLHMANEIGTARLLLRTQPRHSM